MWDVFKDWIFDCIAFFANFLGDWGLAIIVITVIFRLLVAPIMHKQIKSTFQMQKVQPLMQEIQEVRRRPRSSERRNAKALR